VISAPSIFPSFSPLKRKSRLKAAEGKRVSERMSEQKQKTPPELSRALTLARRAPRQITPLRIVTIHC